MGIEFFNGIMISSIQGLYKNTWMRLRAKGLHWILFRVYPWNLRPISRPGTNQRLLYNGHKRVPAIKFQSLLFQMVLFYKYVWPSLSSGQLVRLTEIWRPNNVRPQWPHISRGVRGHPPGKGLKFCSCKWLFLHFEDNFEQNKSKLFLFDLLLTFREEIQWRQFRFFVVFLALSVPNPRSSAWTRISSAVLRSVSTCCSFFSPREIRVDSARAFLSQMSSKNEIRSVVSGDIPLSFSTSLFCCGDLVEGRSNRYLTALYVTLNFIFLTLFRVP